MPTTVTRAGPGAAPASEGFAVPVTRSRNELAPRAGSLSERPPPRVALSVRPGRPVAERPVGGAAAAVSAGQGLASVPPAGMSPRPGLAAGAPTAVSQVSGGRAEGAQTAPQPGRAANGARPTSVERPATPADIEGAIGGAPSAGVVPAPALSMLRTEAAAAPATASLSRIAPGPASPQRESPGGGVGESSSAGDIETASLFGAAGRTAPSTSIARAGAAAPSRMRPSEAPAGGAARLPATQGQPAPAVSARTPERLASLGDSPIRTESARRPIATEHDLTRQVTEQIATFGCGRVGVRTVGPLGEVELGGMVAQTARDDLLAHVAAVPGVTSVTGGLAVDAPCAAFAFLSRTAGPADDPARLPAERVVHPGALLGQTLRTPDFPAYILFDFLAADGTVYHLDSQNWRPEPFRPDVSLELGGAGIGVTVRVSGEPARELLLVVASETPLFPRPRMLSENGAPYLEALAEAIAAARATGAQVEILPTLMRTAAGPADLAADAPAPR